MPCKNECAIIDTIYTRSVPIIFGKVGQSFCFVKFDTTMPYMVKIAQLMIP